MGRGNFSIPGPYLAISGTENMDFNFTKPIKSFGIDMYESTNTDLYTLDPPHLFYYIRAIHPTRLQILPYKNDNNLIQ